MLFHCAVEEMNWYVRLNAVDGDFWTRLAVDFDHLTDIDGLVDRAYTSARKTAALRTILSVGERWSWSAGVDFDGHSLSVGSYRGWSHAI